MVITTPVTRSESNGNLLVGAAPLLFRNPALLGPPAFRDTPTYPILPLVSNGYGTQSINGFAKNIQVPRADSWQAGITRSVGKSMALEVRYVGTRGHGDWSNLNQNEFNIVENGFLNEFKQAQTNLQANIANGRGNTFAFTGAPGTAPLPVFLAFFNGLSAANAGNAAAYAGGNWTNATFLGFLAAQQPAAVQLRQRRTRRPRRACSATPRCRPTRPRPACPPTTSSPTRKTLATRA